MDIIEDDVLSKGVQTYQIDCNKDEEFCEQTKIQEHPDILAFKENKVFAYFTQR